ncbi:MAG: hypothetical protein AABZ47_16560 [Planctomycetota bacterium]
MTLDVDRLVAALSVENLTVAAGAESNAIEDRAVRTDDLPIIAVWCQTAWVGCCQHRRYLATKRVL